MNDFEVTKKLLTELKYLYSAIGDAEDKVENLRDYANDVAEALQDFFNHLNANFDWDYTNALDDVLNHSNGEAYKSLVGVFGLTDGEAERAQKQYEAAEEHRQNEAKKWAKYLDECEEKGVSPYIETKPTIPQQGDWVAS